MVARNLSPSTRPDLNYDSSVGHLSLAERWAHALLANTRAIAALSAPRLILPSKPVGFSCGILVNWAGSAANTPRVNA